MHQSLLLKETEKKMQVKVSEQRDLRKMSYQEIQWPQSKSKLSPILRHSQLIFYFLPPEMKESIRQ